MRKTASRASVKPRQQGVVLLIALIALVAMTLAALGLMRSIDTGTLVAGNIGFRQSAVASADAGVEAARAWILGGGGGFNDNASMGYYSTRQDSLDITGNRTAGGTDGVDWGGSDPAQPTKAYDAGVLDATGNHIYWLINRLCTKPGAYNIAGQDCALSYGNSGTGSTQRTVDTPDQPLFGNPYYFYRVTVRVDGPKNTTSYIQTTLIN